MRTLSRWRRLSWTAVVAGLLLPAAADVLAQEEGGGEAPRWTSHVAGLGVTGISSLQIHPKDRDGMYACVHGLGPARSTDGGLTWTALLANPVAQGVDPRHVPGPRDPCTLSLDPSKDQVLWFVAKGQIYVSDDRGATWHSRTTQALASWSWDRRRSAMLVRGLVVDPTKSLRLLAGTRTEGEFNGGLFESTDGGLTWDQVAGSNMANSKLGPDAWPIVLDPKTDKAVLVGGAAGLWLSTDRGRSFTRADPGKVGVHDVRCLTPLTARREVYLADSRGIWKSRDGGKSWAKEPLVQGDALWACVDPHVRDRVFVAVRGEGVLVSADSKQKEWTSLGAVEADIHEIVCHPREKNVVYFASPTTGLHVSRDGGKTIEPVVSNMAQVVPPVVAAAFHPVDVDRVLALTRTGAVFVSQDRAQTWTRAGHAGMAPTALLGDETTGTWWAAGGQIRRTRDNGATWEVVFRPADPEDRVVSLTRLADGALWALLERSKTCAWSADGGTNWRLTGAPSDASWATSLAVDPRDPRHLLMATRSRLPLWTASDRDGGPYESWDGGATWRQLSEGLLAGREPLRQWNWGTHVALDPGSGTLLYVAAGLGLFARPGLEPKGARPPTPAPWVEVASVLPKPAVTTLLLANRPADEGRDLLMQVVGENETRAFVRAGVEELLAEGDGPVSWETLPDPAATLAALSRDPHLPGRLLAADAQGTSGVMVYGIPGERPVAAPREGAQVPPADAPRAPAEPRPADVPDVPPPPAGLLAFTGGAEGVRVWSVAGRDHRPGPAGPEGEALAVALSHAHGLLATAGAGPLVHVHAAADGTLQDTLGPEGHANLVSALAFDPRRRLLFVGAGDGAIVAWDLESRTARRLEGHGGAVVDLAVSADGSALLSGSRDGTARCWDLATGSATCVVEFGAPVEAVAFSADGTRAYVAGKGPRVALHALPGGEPTGEIPLEGFDEVSSLAVDLQGRLLYVAGSGGVRSFSVPAAAADGPSPAEAYEAAGAVRSLAVSRDGRWIVAGGADGGLRVFAKARPTPWWTHPGAHAGPVEAVALTADAMPDEGAPLPERSEEGESQGAPGGSEQPPPAPQEPSPPPGGGEGAADGRG